MEQERNLGEQPLRALMETHALKPHALVAASKEQITHKMVARACKGRRLTHPVQNKILRALNAATGQAYHAADLFNYGKPVAARPVAQEDAPAPQSAG